MRVLHVISTLDPRAGGPPAALRGLTVAQRAIGIDARILATFARDADLSMAESLQTQGVPVQLVGPTRGPLARHRDLKPAVAQAVADADIIHIHALWEEIQHQAARFARKLRKPYIIRPCGMLDPWSLRQSKWRKRLYMAVRLRRTLHHAAAIHFTARSEQDLTAPLGLKAPGIVMPNGIDLGEFQSLPPRGFLRGRFALPRDAFLVVFFSRIHPKKGLDLLIPAFAGLRQSSAARLAIIGPDEGGYRRRVEAMVREYRIEDRVVFTGPLYGTDRVAALTDADLFVLSSYQENFGNAVIEALAAGVPVIVSDQVGIHRELTAAGVADVVPLDRTRLTGAIARWLGDARMRQQAADKARAFARDTYDWQRIAERWYRHYRTLLEDGRGRA